MRINTILTEGKRPVLNEPSRSEFSPCHPTDTDAKFQQSRQLPGDQGPTWAEKGSLRTCVQQERAGFPPSLTQELLGRNRGERKENPQDLAQTRKACNQHFWT